MTTIMPSGENLRKAVKWISDMRQQTPKPSETDLIQKACLKFNLTPKEADYLTHFEKNSAS